MITGVDNGYSYADNVLTISLSGEYTISMAGVNETSKDRIVVDTDGWVNLTISGINVTSSVESPLRADGGDLFLILEGENTLTSTASGFAGLSKSSSENELIIRSVGYDPSYGILTASGGDGAAGIGGGSKADGCNIEIAGGTVIALSGDNGAGIGGGYSGNAYGILISGGIVNASSIDGAAIGSGTQSYASEVTITGGTVTAEASGGAGIGAGSSFNDETVKVNISGGNIKASSVGGEAIGCGEISGSVSEEINITGGCFAEADTAAGTVCGAAVADSCYILEVSGDYPYYVINNADKTFSISGNNADGKAIAEGSEYTYDEDVLTIISGGTYKITMNIAYAALLTETDKIVVGAPDGDEVNLTISDIYVISAEDSPFKAESGDLNLILEGENTLTAAGSNYAGLLKTSTSNTLKITSCDGDGAASGSLTATGGYNAAGIGGGSGSPGYNIEISGGTVNAAGGTYAAGIGGGYWGIANGIVINGGVVNASSGGGAAIGSGYNTSLSSVTITGGTITAAGGGGGAGIGGGSRFVGDVKVNISGGYITASSDSGEAIGYGTGASGSLSKEINITGGYFAEGDTAAGTVCGAAVADSCYIAEVSGDYPYYVINADVRAFSISGKNANGDEIAENSEYTYDENILTITSGGTYNISMNTTEGIILTQTDKIVVGAPDGDEVDLTISDINVTISDDSPFKAESGNLNLILEGDNYLTATASNYAGLSKTSTSNKLKITSCDGDSATSGSLTAAGGYNAAGIGGGFNGDGRNIEFAGGTVTASSGDNTSSSSSSFGAGIGGGYWGNAYGILISGGIVNASSDTGAAIGSGFQRYGSEVTITGGTVTATARGYGAGIGAGSSFFDGTVKVNISGGNIKASSGSGEAIGYGALTSGSVSKEINITGGWFAEGDTAAGTVYGVAVADSCYILEMSGDYPYYVINADVRAFSISGKNADGDEIAEDSEYTYDENILTITSGGAYNISMNKAEGIILTQTDKIVVGAPDGDEVNLTISNINVTASDDSPLKAESGNLNLILEGDNYLTATASGYAGLLKTSSSNKLTITSCNGDGATFGSLTATGGYNAAGIGGGSGSPGYNIEINGGTVNAAGGTYGAGIGGGYWGIASGIVINGGVVNASSGGGAAIGSGYNTSISSVTITGGTITAAGGGGGAGIGGGCRTAGEVRVSISGGYINATSDTGEGIGYGSGPFSTAYKTFTITGGRFSSGDPDADTVCDGIVSEPYYVVELANGGSYPYCIKTSDFKAFVITGTNSSGGEITEGTEYTYEDNVLTINSAGDYKVTLTSEINYTNDDRIVVDADGAVNLTISKVDIRSLVDSPVRADGGDLTLILEGTNSLTAKTSGYAGILKTSDSNTLIITSNTGSGRLSVTGGSGAAGIGGNSNCDGVNIKIAGGTVTAASSGYGGAGIGGGGNGSGNNIEISGGTVTATGGLSGASIGGGYYGSGNNIEISGGTVTATGVSDGAGIGGGYYGDGNGIVITGGTVTASSDGGASIGSGWGGSNCSITITGGTVYAEIAGGGAGIGGGIEVRGEVSVTISGGYIDAPGNNSIGRGSAPSSTATEEIIITGGCFSTGSMSDNTVCGASVYSGYWVSKNTDSNTMSRFPYIVETYNESDVCAFTITGDDISFAEHYTYANNVLTVRKAGAYTISMNWDMGTSTSTDRIIVNVDGDAEITIENLDITSSINTPFEVSSGNVTLLLKGDNIFKSTASDYPGLKKDFYYSTLIIDSYNGTDEGGSLTASGGKNGAGIGGGSDGSGSSITIAGGIVTASSSGSAGIGGGSMGNGSDIIISGGFVTAESDTGAGIGGGNGGSGSNVTISGGTVTATSTGNGAGIGGGYNGSGSNITITGGNITASAYNAGAGIGGGDHGSGSDITITGGKVNASSNSNGAGIGGGDNTSGTNITITGGNITAESGKNGAGIGGGGGSSGGDITITGGNITATSSGDGAGIGGGTGGSGSNITISDGEVTASSSGDGAGIGGGTGSCGINITISGGISTADSGNDGAGIGGGSGSYGDYISITDGEITTSSSNDGAGIGGGSGSYGTNITITGGNITAAGGNNGAGIGGGSGGKGNEILISGGTVTASSSNNGAGIGAGENNVGSYITILGGTVNASSDGENSTGIGGGYGSYCTGIYLIGGTVNASRIGSNDNANSYVTISGGYINCSSIHKTTNIHGGYFKEADISAGTVWGVSVNSNSYITDNLDPNTNKDYPYMVISTKENAFLISGTDSSGSTIAEGTDYTYENNVLTITSGGTYSITMNTGLSSYSLTYGGIKVSATQTDRIVISAPESESVSVTITDLYVVGTSGSPIKAESGNITLKLKGSSSLISASANYAALSKSNSGKLKITSADGDGSTAGSLTAFCDDVTYGAAIGGDTKVSADNIEISGGTITATSFAGAAIGGGYTASGTNIKITGGSVSVTSTSSGAGIGGGYDGTGSNITITGGTVSASSLYGAVIGGGRGAAGDSITISGGYVRASTVHGAAIGGGYQNKGSNISVSGGYLYLVSSYGDMLGSGRYGDTAENISVTGGCFNKGDISANTVYGIQPDSGYLVIKNNDTETNETYPYNVRPVGDLVITGDNIAEGTDYTYDDRVLKIIKAGTYKITMATEGSATTTDRIAVEADGDVVLTIENINITSSSEAPFRADGGDLTLILEGSSSLTAGGGTYAALEKNNGTNTLTITSSDGTEGSLTAAASYGAGIGGDSHASTSGIIISGGVITASSTDGAGIGGGFGDYAENITITGGKVTASSYYGAGIGGGFEGYANGIKISGGYITASSTGGSTIGSGQNGASSENIEITGGYFHSGNRVNNTVYGIEVDSSFSVELNTDEDTMAEYPYVVADYLRGFVFVNSDAAEGEDYTYKNKVLTILKAGTYEVTMADGITETNDRIVVDADGEVNFTINSINVDCELESPLRADGGDLNLILSGSSYLTASSEDYAALTKENSGNVLTITDDGAGGSLTAVGGKYSAGIGGGRYESAADISITGGVINAAGGEAGAGIGGGYNGSGTNITIYGGTVTAAGGQYGAGIGGGRYESGSNITISGGSVTASSADMGAGIGGGQASDGTSSGSNIIITGDCSVIASSTRGAAIGGGYSSDGASVGSNITIVSGTVKASSTDGAAIGSGANHSSSTTASSSASNISIEGGYITLSSINGDCIGVGKAGGTVTNTAVTGGYFGEGDEESETVYSTAVYEGCSVHPNKDTATNGEYPYYVKGFELVITGTSAVIGTDYTYKNGALTVLTSGDYNVSMATDVVKTETDRIVVDADGDVSLTITGVNIESNSNSALRADGGNLTLILEGDNYLTSASEDYAALAKTSSSNTLKITSIDGDERATGSLTAKGGTNGAGIGGDSGSAGVNIEIAGGTVTASGTNGAGIGGGLSAGSTGISISGGYVKVSSTNGSSIGSGSGGAASDITITGGYFVQGSVDGNVVYGIQPADGYNVYQNTETASASSYPYRVREHRDLVITGTDIAELDNYTYNDGVLTITAAGTYAITMDSETVKTEKDRIVVNADGDVIITITDVDITSSENSPFRADGGNITLILDGDNYFTSTNEDCAGLLKDSSSNSLKITSIDGDGCTAGSLTAVGGQYGAGIGGGKIGDGRSITISGGTVTAIGGSSGAGIGGGKEGDGWDITVNGGIVTATGGQNGAGIGGGSFGDGWYITIEGGLITATGGSYAAGIGGGYYSGYSRVVNITGGTINAGGYVSIGCGRFYSGTNIYATVIDGGSVKAPNGFTTPPVNSDGDELTLYTAANTTEGEKITINGKTYVESVVYHSADDTNQYLYITAADLASLNGPGDVDGDGDVDKADAALLLKYLSNLAALTENGLAAGDFNGDGSIDLTDVTALLKYINS